MAKRHGYGGTRVYQTWKAMRQRCRDPKAHNFKHYGGRGVTVCARWNVFENFLADMGEPQMGQSIGRIDNSRGYEPDNCRWETQATQLRNYSKNRLLTIEGVTRCLQDWADIFKISRTTISHRLRSGWPVKEAVTTPAHSAPIFRIEGDKDRGLRCDESDS